MGIHILVGLGLYIESTPGSQRAWWRHQIEIFSPLLTLWEGNPPLTGGFPSQRPVTRSFEFFFDLRLNKRLSKQPRRRWFETPSHSLWRHCNGIQTSIEPPPVYPDHCHKLSNHYISYFGRAMLFLMCSIMNWYISVHKLTSTWPC